MSCFKESRDGWLLNCENNSLQKGGLSLVSRNHRLFGRAKHSLRDKECDQQSCLRRGIKGGIGTMRTMIALNSPGENEDRLATNTPFYEKNLSTKSPGDDVRLDAFAALYR
jgi:hypothetical protein